MAADHVTEVQKIASTSTASSATFEGGIQQCYISADGDCFISFDQQVPVVSGHSLLIKANLAPVRIDFRGGNVKTVRAISSGSVNVYILGIRN